MSDAFENWDTDDKGHLKVWPLLAFSTALFGGETGGLRLEIGKAQPKPGEAIAALQLVLTADQLRALGEALIEVAETIGASASGARKPSHSHG